MNPVEVRNETAADQGAIFALHAHAFNTPAEARLVDALREGGGLALSLVATLHGRIVGHIAFSPVTVVSEEGTAHGMGLGPMAVSPQVQRSGIGSALVTEGLTRLRATHTAFCVVLGHADYYPRFGFQRASAHGIRWEHNAPDACFFVQALRPGGLQGVTGVVRFRPEFNGL